MSDVICLSSDEEDKARPPKKKRKAESEPNRTEKKKVGDCVLLSSEDEDDDGCNPEQQEKRAGDLNGTDKENEDVQEKPSENGALCENGINGEVQDTDSDAFTTFFNVCVNAIKATKVEAHIKLIEDKVKAVEKLHVKVGPEYCNSSAFQQLLVDNTEKVRKQSKLAGPCFRHVYEELKRGYFDTRPVSPRTDKRVAKLEKLIRKLHRKIKKLEETEVDFDDEENSHYIQLEAYQKKLMQAYELSCKLKKENMRATLNMYPRLDFAGSR